MARGKGKLENNNRGAGSYDNLHGSAWLNMPMQGEGGSRAGKPGKSFTKKYCICRRCGANLPARGRPGSMLCPRCMIPMDPM